MKKYWIRFMIGEEVLVNWKGEASGVIAALASAMFDRQLPDWTGEGQSIEIECC